MAKRRDLQEKLRAEINDTLAEVRARGDADFTANDFERMPYLVAIIKVRRDLRSYFYTRTKCTRLLM